MKPHLPVGSYELRDGPWPSRMTPRIFFTAAIFASIANAIPTIELPLNSQVPPIARVSEPFTYTFSNSTFSSILPLSYILTDAPSWLSLDSSTRTLSGTPSANDVGTTVVNGINIGLTASDHTGSVTMNATIIVSTNPAPIISIPISSQLASFGTFSLPSTILYHPSTDFNFTFEPGTFTDNGGTSGLSYYSVTLVNTPLPSWIQFDGSSLSFSGRTPDYQSLIQPPQTFGIQLIASDIEGFSGVSVPFEIEVGVHLLAFKNTDLIINATAGVDVMFDGLSNNLELDGAPANHSSLASVTAETPSWLSFDNDTLSLSGIVPADAVPINISIQATDIYGDIDNAIVYLDILTAVFNSQIGPLNVSSGAPFSFDFSSYVRNKSDVEMRAQFSPVTSWIVFDSQSLILSGTVPPTTPQSEIGITLTAISKSSQRSTSQSFDLYVASDSGQLPQSSSLASHSPSATGGNVSSPTYSPASISRHKRLSGGVIAAIIVPICLAMVAILIAFCCCMQRRRAAQTRPRSPAKSEISAPVEVSSSVAEIVRPNRIAPPIPLQLDTSEFTIEQSTSTSTSEQKARSGKLADNPLRRSQTMSAVSRPSKDEFRLSDTMRARAYSDNALSRTDKSWRSTQDSAYPTISSSSQTNSSHRLTRNYSRKGQDRRSGRLKSRESVVRHSNLDIQRPQSRTLNIRDSHFSFTPLEKLSISAKHTSTQPLDMATSGKTLSRSISAKRKSRLVSGIDQKSGVGHGGRESITSLTSVPAKRRSVGHGQNRQTTGLSRESSTWLPVTLGSAGRDPVRLSNVSAITEKTDVLESDPVAPLNLRRHHIRRVPPSSGGLSESSPSTRRMSRRGAGSSPFFAGGASTRSSRMSPHRTRSSYADSPTVPMESIGGLEHSGESDLVEKNTPPRDSLGIAYVGPREGTRQLRSYIQSRLAREKTNSSMKSTESNDSRFESADSLNQSQPNIVIHGRSSEIGQEGAKGDDQYEDDLREDFSDGSWETHRSTPPDSLRNIIECGLGESSHMAMASKHALGPATALRSHLTSPLPPDQGTMANMVQGRGMRPLSADADGKQGSVRAIIESDYAAYI